MVYTFDYQSKGPWLNPERRHKSVGVVSGRLRNLPNQTWTYVLGDPGEEACRVKDAAFGVLEVSLSTARSDLKVNFLRRPLLERLTHCVHMSVRCNIFQVTKYSTV